MSIFYDERPDGYSLALANLNKILDQQLASIRGRQDDGALTIRQAADERIAALEQHLAELRKLREVHFGGGFMS